MSVGAGRLFSRPMSTAKFLSQKPVMHINIESKAGWYDILDGLPQHEALPPGIRSALDEE